MRAQSERSSDIRILLVIDGLGWGGSQRQMANLAVGLAARGHGIHLAVYRPGHKNLDAVLAGSGVELVEVPKRTKLGLGVAVGLARHARRARCEAAIAFLPTPSTYAVLAGRLAGFPVVVSERSFFLPGALPFEERLRRQPHRLAAHVTANSQHQRERLEREFPWLRGRCSTIWNGIDVESFHPAEPRERGDVLRVLGVGSVGPVKQIDVLARAVVALVERGGPPVEVTWAGKLIDEPASRAVRAEVDALLARHGLAERWRWLGLRDDIPSLHREHDVLVHPSATEGLPNALCEALASGLPIVASRSADHPLLVGANERGALFEPGDPASLATALAHVAALDSEARRTLGAEARRFALRELSIEACAGRYEQLLANLVIRPKQKISLPA